MPRKTKKTSIKPEEEEVIEEPFIEGSSQEETEAPQLEEPVIEGPFLDPEPTPKPKKSNTVTVMVLVGSLRWEGGTYQKGDVFEVSEDRLKLFDPNDIKVL